MPHIKTRGVVIAYNDLSFAEWPQLAASHGLNTIGLHPFPENSLPDLAAFISSDEGNKFLQTCRSLGIEVEYEIHAMNHLLPRSLFDSAPEMFRMDESGARIREINMCPSNSEALEILGHNAAELSRVLKPTTGRHFLWGTDSYGWCKCPKCRHLSDSDQALIVENAMLRALRAENPEATLAHLAYAGTAAAPVQVMPENGIFLEFAPIHRCHDIPYAEQKDCEEALDHLDANLELFGRDTAQVLEYWLDVSLFSQYKRPPQAIPWSDSLFASDLQTYAARGIRHITTFAVFADNEYVKLHGVPPIDAYGRILREWTPDGTGRP